MAVGEDTLYPEYLKYPQRLKLAFCGELVVGAEREDFLSLYFSVCLSMSVCVIIIDVLFVYSLLS